MTTGRINQVAILSKTQHREANELHAVSTRNNSDELHCRTFLFVVVAAEDWHSVVGFAVLPTCEGTQERGIHGKTTRQESDFFRGSPRERTVGFHKPF